MALVSEFSSLIFGMGIALFKGKTVIRMNNSNAYWCLNFSRIFRQFEVRSLKIEESNQAISMVFEESFTIIMDSFHEIFFHFICYEYFRAERRWRFLKNIKWFSDFARLVLNKPDCTIYCIIRVSNFSKISILPKSKTL